MKLGDPDIALLEDMRAFALEARSLVDGVSFDRYAADRMRKLALERALELVGEVARRVSEERQRAIPGIPWRDMIGQRNVLAHMYGRIDHSQLYLTATGDLGELVAAIDRVLGDARA
jgi:uncharacterized protein with HEPN domain